MLLPAQWLNDRLQSLSLHPSQQGCIRHPFCPLSFLFSFAEGREKLGKDAC